MKKISTLLFLTCISIFVSAQYTLTDEDVFVNDNIIIGRSYDHDHWDTIKNIVIPNVLHDQIITSIIRGSGSAGTYPFFNYLGLESIQLPTNLEIIGPSAFGDNRLTEISLPATLITIDDGAFNENIIESITIPQKVKTIGENAFVYNELKNVTFENNSDIEYIGNGAFEGNTNLNTIILPNHTNPNFLQYKDSNGNTYSPGDAITDFTISYEAVFSSSTKYAVTFVDWNDTELKVDSVARNSSAEPPTPPYRDGYTFIGWDIDFSNVTSDLTVTAQYYNNTLRANDSLALAALYNNCNGPNWIQNDNWLNGPLDSWHGITVKDGRVISIVLYGNYNSHFGLNGNLPSEMGNLTELSALVLSYNDLTGTLPNTLGQLTKLKELIIDDNQFEGSIPEQFNNMISLERINLSNNDFNGSLPSSWGNLSNLYYMMIASNRFTFGDIEPIHNWNNFNNLDFNYFNQAKVGTEKNLFTSVGDSIRLIIENYKAGESDRYQWYRRGYPIEGATDLTYSISSISTVDEGSYECKITNDVATEITIWSNKIFIEKVAYEVSSQDSLALVALYNSTGGESWINNENWLTGRLEDWYGVYLVDGHVRTLYLSNNNLQGNIPREIGDLSQTTYISLYNNSLIGNLPIEIGNLSELENLVLFNNELSGEIPKSLFSIISLKVFNIAQNLITGTIPGNLEPLINLEEIQLGNNLIDSLPDLVLPSSLKFITVNENKLTFEDLEYNMDEFYKLESDYNTQKPYGTEKTILLNIGEDYLLQTTCGGSQNHYRWYKNGSVISDYSNSPELQILNFNNSDIGEYYCKVENDLVPELTLYSEPIFLQVKIEPCNASDSLALVAMYNSTEGENWNINWNLNSPVATWNGITIEDNRVTEIILNENNLTGTLPSEMADLTELKTLHLWDNNLSGTLQPLTSLLNLDYIVCDNNQFSGNLTPLSNKENMYWISFENNQLSGDIGEITNLNKLEGLFLNGNLFSGAIPSSIGKLDSLEYLYLYSNDFDGSIPKEIGDLQNLIRFYAHDNNLSGEIPTAIGNLFNLEYLALYQNNLSGNIPSEIGNLYNLLYLGLFENNLSGELPTSLGNLSKLGRLVVSNNHFSGQIPEDIGNLSELYLFYINNNSYVHFNIEPILGWSNYPNLSYFVYAPQDTIGIKQTIPVTEGDNVTITIDNYTPSASDSYKWYKDGAEIPGATSRQYNISSAGEGDIGTYHCIITNSRTTELSLISNNIVVSLSSSPTYAVTFEDYDGTILKTETVEFGNGATAPGSLERTGYTFTGWNVTYDNIVTDLTVTATYTINTYSVTFKDYNDTILKTDTVEYGEAATQPVSPTRKGYTFTGWDIDFSNVTSDLTVTAMYISSNTALVSIEVKNGESWSPENPSCDGDNNGVTVMLLDVENPDKNNPLHTQTTNSSGIASFEDIPYGKYIVYLEKESLTNLLEPELTENIMVGFVPFGVFQSQAEVDASGQPDAYVGGPVFRDNNNDGIYNINDKEPGRNIEVSDNTENYICYIFSIIPQGDYIISGYIYEDSTSTTKSVSILSESSEDRSPMQGVTVLLFEKGQEEQIGVDSTDDQGYYEFNKLVVGNYELQVKLSGYTDSEKFEVALDDNSPEAAMNFLVNSANATITDVESLNVPIGKIYPNPTTGIVNIELETKMPGDATIKVFNIGGAKVFEKVYRMPEKIYFDLSEKISGLYLIEITTNDQQITKKLILDKK